jgi:hypothetical protein
MMNKFLAVLLVSAAPVSPAFAETFHYACTRPNRADGSTLRYALTVNTNRHVVTLLQHFPPYGSQTFRILPGQSDCAKYGWILDGGGSFCTATQGSGTLDWHGLEFDCDQADTE